MLPNKRGQIDDSKGKETLLPFEVKKSKSSKMVGRGTVRLVAPGEGTSKKLGEILGTRASVMASSSVVEKILVEVIVLTNKEKVDKLSLDPVATKFLHILGMVFICFHPRI